jgi:hypothetical protein
MIGQTDTITRGADLAMTMVTTRAAKWPQGIREAAKKGASVGTTGSAEEMTRVVIDQETLTYHPKTSSMDHVTYTLDT